MEKITRELDKRFVTKTELARRLGLSRQTLYKRLKHGNWTLKEAAQLTEILGCKLTDLV